MTSERLAQLTRARIYEIAAEYCGPLFPAAPTKDQEAAAANVHGVDLCRLSDPVVDGQATVDVEALIAAAEQEMLAAIADKFAALRAAARATNPTEAPSDCEVTDLITPGHAVHLTGVARPTLYRLCKDHPIGSPGGFSLWREDEQRFLISRSRLESLLRRRPLRVRRIKTKKPTG
jgi:hypothetical protein